MKGFEGPTQGAGHAGRQSGAIPAERVGDGTGCGDHTIRKRAGLGRFPMFGSQYVLGAVYVLTILYLPMGLMGIPERLRQRQRFTANREDVKKMAPVAS
jgi:hypothetical protein